MPSKSLQVRLEIASAAREQLDALERSYSDLLGDIPVNVSKIAEALGILVRRDRQLRQRARLEVLRIADRLSAVVTLHEGLPLPEARFALGHEIAHFLLLRERSRLAASMTVAEREIFANTFATELSIPRTCREELKTRFRGTRDPLDLLALSSRLGIAVSVFLRFASGISDWFRDLPLIWLRVKHVPNEYTGKESRLRIVSAHYDWHRYYVPVNQSLVRVTADGWLSNRPVGAVVREQGAVNISLNIPDRVPRYPKVTLPAALAAVRLRPSDNDLAPYFIVMTELDVDSMASLFPSPSGKEKALA